MPEAIWALTPLTNIYNTLVESAQFLNSRLWLWCNIVQYGAIWCNQFARVVRSKWNASNAIVVTVLCAVVLQQDYAKGNEKHNGYGCCEISTYNIHNTIVQSTMRGIYILIVSYSIAQQGFVCSLLYKYQKLHIYFIINLLMCNFYNYGKHIVRF